MKNQGFLTSETGIWSQNLEKFLIPVLQCLATNSPGDRNLEPSTYRCHLSHGCECDCLARECRQRSFDLGFFNI